MEKNNGIWLLAIYLFLAVYLLPMFPHGGSANELTRWATAASIVEKGSFDIAWTEELIGPNVDTAKVGNSTYSNKPPGVAILSTPVYALTRIFIGPPDESNIRISWFFMKLVASTLPLFLLAVWMYRKGTTDFGLATLLFATPLFGYSLLLFSHVLAAALLYTAFKFLFDEEENSARRNIAAGAACGMAVLSEFPAIIVVIVFIVGLYFTADRTRRFGYFVVGGLPFAGFLLAYNAALFGSPLSFSYAHESFPEWAQVASRGILGIGIPTPSNAYLLLFSPARGLFFYAPILLIAVIHFFRSPDRSTLRFRVRLAAIVAVVVLMCGHGAAHGGWGFGPRYLVLIVPLLIDSFFRSDQSEQWLSWRGALLAASIVFCTLPVLTFPFAPPEFNFPQNDFWRTFLFDEQWFVPTLLNMLGLPSRGGMLLPVLFSLTAIAIFVARSASAPRRFWVGVVAGVVVCSGVIFAPGFDSGDDQFRRATIAERYFIPRQRVDKFSDGALASGNWPFVRRINDARWNIADVRAFAPNDFPYAEASATKKSPTAFMRTAVQMMQRGEVIDAERALLLGKESFAFGQCEFSGNLAVIYYSSGDKGRALTELESVQPLVNRGSRPDCLRTQYLLGTLYAEMSRAQDAENTFRAFLLNTSDTNDPELSKFRQQLSRQGIK